MFLEVRHIVEDRTKAFEEDVLDLLTVQFIVLGNAWPWHDLRLT